MHEADRDRKKSARRTEHLLAQQKKLTEKRERIIEFALDGTFDKAERDRRLKMVEGYARFCTECLNCTPSEREKREYQFFSRWPSTSGERPVR